MQTSHIKSWKVIEEGREREREKKLCGQTEEKKDGLRGRMGRWREKNENAKTEGVNVGWQVPHVRSCRSPSEHFSLHAVARAGGAQWQRERGREGERDRGREREREREGERGQVTLRVAGVLSASLTSCSYFTLFFSPQSLLASFFPVVQPLTPLKPVSSFYLWNK